MTQKNDIPPPSDAATRNVEVLNRYGIHARPAALIVKVASRYGTPIVLEKNGVKVNAKSIMGLLTLEGSFGAKITITATGPDAPKAVAEIADLFEKKFFED